MLTPLAEICIKLIDRGDMEEKDIPTIIEKEVLEYYKSLKGGEAHE